jgi:hypothetical protein
MRGQAPFPSGVPLTAALPVVKGFGAGGPKFLANVQVNGVGSATGTATCSGVGASVCAAVGSSAGTGSASAVGKSLNAATATASGAAIVAGVGKSLASGVATSTGASSASGVGNSLASAVATSSGTSTCLAVGSTGSAIVAGTGTTAGTSSALGEGASLVAARPVAVWMLQPRERKESLMQRNSSLGLPTRMLRAHLAQRELSRSIPQRSREQTFAF